MGAGQKGWFRQEAKEEKLMNRMQCQASMDRFSLDKVQIERRGLAKSLIGFPVFLWENLFGRRGKRMPTALRALELSRPLRSESVYGQRRTVDKLCICYTQSQVTQTSFETPISQSKILLPPTQEFLGYRCAMPYSIYAVLRMEPTAMWMLGKHSII